MNKCLNSLYFHLAELELQSENDVIRKENNEMKKEIKK